MARDRARSSFTVEVRRGRSTPVDTDPKRALWRGHDLAGEAARHEAAVGTAAPLGAAPAAPARDLFAPRHPAAAAGGAAPRILPSLIAAPALVEEAAPEPEPEGRLPRVRRVRAPRPTPEPVLAGPDPDEVFDDDLPEASPPADGLPDAVAASAPRLRRREPRGERVLRAGERWKRRLPRALW